MTTADCLVIAHRGASSYAPENTLVACDLALQMGCRHLQLDVDITCDGHIVVMHDEMVDRTTNGTGPVGSHTLAELRALDGSAWFGGQFTGERIPTDVADRDDVQSSGSQPSSQLVPNPSE
jgi:glycerophosphoryl diester phosphodiesterase